MKFPIFLMKQKYLYNVKKAKYAVKILAWFEEFNNFIINISGFSLWGQVIKYCIKELDKIRSIKGHTIKINNALFLAAAADMRKDKKINGEIYLEIISVEELLVVFLDLIGF